MAGPLTVDTLTDAPPVTATTRISSSQVLWPQRVVVGPLLFNVLSDLYSASSTVAAKVTAAAADANLGNANGLVVIPPLASGMVPPAAPTVTVQGAAGTTTYSYFVIAINAAGDVVVSQTTTIANGNATLNVTNFNAVSWSAVTGATSYKLVRLVVGGTEGVVATQTGTSFNDQGGTVSTFTYPATNLTTLGENVMVLDQRYLPTNQAAGIALPTTDMLNGFQTSTFKLNRTFAGGADNGSLMALSMFLTGGQGGNAGPDGENTALYVEATRRIASTRAMWGMNINYASDASPSATLPSFGIEVDMDNNGAADATNSTPFDGVSVLSAGTHKARFGFLVGNSAGQLWYQGMHIGSVYFNTALRIDAPPGGAQAGVLGLDVAANSNFGGHLLNNQTPAPTLGTLQTGIASQSISGTDTRFTVTVTAAGGGGPGAFGVVCTVNFGTAFSATPFVVIAPSGNTFAGGVTNVMINSVSTSSVQIITQATMPANQQQSYTCLVIG